MAELGLAEELPEPGLLWVRYRPRRWPGAAGLWLDPVRGRLGRAARAAARDALPSTLGRGLDDVLHLPPVAAGLEAWRDRLLAEAIERGIPTLAQIRPGRVLAAPRGRVVYDLTETLVRRDLDALSELETAAVLLWPLLRGVTDDAELVAAALERAVPAAPAAVVGVIPELAPDERRRLAEAAGEGSWEALFHGGPPSLRDFCRAVHRAGLEPFFERPLPAAPARRVANRRLAARLGLAAELWLRLGRGSGRGQELFRAARWIDRERHDVARLAREGNLGIVGELDEATRELVGEIATTGRLGLLEELRREYLG